MQILFHVVFVRCHLPLLEILKTMLKLILEPTHLLPPPLHHQLLPPPLHHHFHLHHQIALSQRKNENEIPHLLLRAPKLVNGVGVSKRRPNGL